MPDKKPPKEFLLLPYGRMETTKGNFILTHEAAAEVMMKYKEHGADVNIDYEHQALKATEEPQPAPAAGWGKLSLRDDGIWMTNVKWSDKASTYLTNGEYRYFSPAFSVDPDTKEISELINVAITNLPATHQQEALVSASQQNIAISCSRFTNPTVRLSMKTLANQLAVHAKRLGGTVALAKAVGLSVAALKHHMAGHAPSQEEMNCYHRALGITHGEDTNAPIEHTSLDGMDVNKSMASADEDEPNLHARLNASGESDVEGSPDEADENDGDDDEEEDWDGGTTPVSRMAPKHMGKGPIGFTRGKKVDLVALTGRKNASEQAGVIAGWREAANRYAEDHKALVSLSQEMENNKRRELIALGQASGKLTPALVRLYRERPVSEFKAFLDVAPVINDPAGFQEPAPEQQEAQMVKLSREEREVVELSGWTETETEEYGKTRQLLAQSIKPGSVSFKTRDSKEWEVALTRHFKTCALGKGPTPDGFYNFRSLKSGR